MLNLFKQIIKRKSKKKGFTLMELLAVIVILAIILVITIPTVLGSMNKSKEKSLETVAESIQKYLDENYNNCKLGNKTIAKYDEEIFDEECKLKGENLSDNLIKNTGYSKNDIKKVTVGFEEGQFDVKVKAGSTGNFSGVKDQATGLIIYKQHELKGSIPDLNNGLIPVTYDEEKAKWVVADISEEWYNYSSEKQWWANAVSVNKNNIDRYKNGEEFNGGVEILDSDLLAMFVWIPRFSYAIGCHAQNNCYGFQVEGASSLSQATPGAIDIKFISTDTIDNGDVFYNSYEGKNAEDSYLTHPAFNFGGNISGMWVGKFETSVNPNSECYSSLPTAIMSNNAPCLSSKDDVTPRIVPNVLALRNQRIYDQYITAKKFTSPDNIYGLTGDAHMMKNSEWGAVAYLSQSIYGKYGNSSYSGGNKEIFKNDSSKFITGRSYGQLTTASGQVSSDGEGTYQYHVDYYGTGASTTGNIYGIYDMSGGSFENVMGWYTGASIKFGGTTSNYGAISYPSGFGGEPPDLKYWNSYSNQNIYDKSLETKGHATFETNGWYSDSSDSLTITGSWTIRGGIYDSENGIDIGVFSGSTNSGVQSPLFGFRTVLV